MKYVTSKPESPYEQLKKSLTTKKAKSRSKFENTRNKKTNLTQYTVTIHRWQETRNKMRNPPALKRINIDWNQSRELRVQCLRFERLLSSPYPARLAKMFVRFTWNTPWRAFIIVVWLPFLLRFKRAFAWAYLTKASHDPSDPSRKCQKKL